MSKFLLIPLVALALILGLGCAHGQASPADGHVTIAPGVNSGVIVTSVRCIRNQAGYCMFQANVMNGSKSQVRLEYKVQWLDEAGMEIESLVSTWQMLAVQAKETKGLSAVASSKDAVDFRFYVRPFGR